MIPAVTAQATPVKPVQPAPASTDQKTSQPQAAETSRASAGESGAANMRGETVNAIRAAEQSAVAPRLRSGETAENTDREDPATDAPTGPPPAFEESPLERQARVALDPPEPEAAGAAQVRDPNTEVAEDEDAQGIVTVANEDAQPIDPPPTPTERAEAGFSETRSLSRLQDAPSFDKSA